MPSCWPSSWCCWWPVSRCSAPWRMYERCRIAPLRGVAIVERSTFRRGSVRVRKTENKRENHHAKNNPAGGADGSGRLPGCVRAEFDGTKKFDTADSSGAGRPSAGAPRRRSEREESERSKRSAEQGKRHPRQEDQEHLPRLLGGRGQRRPTPCSPV